MLHAHASRFLSTFENLTVEYFKFLYIGGIENSTSGNVLHNALKFIPRSFRCYVYDIVTIATLQEVAAFVLIWSSF